MPVPSHAPLSRLRRYLPSQPSRLRDYLCNNAARKPHDSFDAIFNGEALIIKLSDFCKSCV